MEQIFNVDISFDDKQTKHSIQATSWIAAVNSITSVTLSEIATDKPLSVNVVVVGNDISITATRLS